MTGWPWGLLSWVLAGLLAAIAGWAIDRPRSGLRVAVLLSAAVVAALAAGVVSTALGFGGFAALDWRSVAIAALAGVAAVFLLLASWRAARRA